MKAPDRRQSRQIRARWLRDNMGQTVEAGAGQISSGNQRTGVVDPDCDSGDAIMVEGVVNGDNSGILRGVGLKSAGSNNHGENHGIINVDLEEGNNVDIQQDGLLIADLKRRRVNEGRGLNYLNGEDGGPIRVSEEGFRGPFLSGDVRKNDILVKEGSGKGIDQMENNGPGLGNPRAIQFLEEIVFQKKPNARGHSGGLAMLWKKEEEGQLLGFSNNHIDLEVRIEGCPLFRATGIYGEPQRSLRGNTWRLIHQLSCHYSLPWCLFGDMNNTLSHSDKRGGRAYPNWLLNGFQDVVSECHLIDMELRGYPFTWEKGRGTSQWVEVRLDRALINHDWQLLFPLASLENLEITVSDHCLIWVNLAMYKPIVFKKKFQNKVCNKILKKLKGRSDQLAVSKYKETQSQLCEALTKKEIFWRQRSKQLWLQVGDQNTKYFHACASNRRRNNQIVKLKNSNGVWVDWDSGLREVMVTHFTDLFTASGSNGQWVIDCIPVKVTADQNQELLLQVEDTEVRKALFQMHPDKSPGPDGFNPDFYQKHWDIVEKDIVDMVQRLFTSGEFPEYLAETNIVLIPKKSQPSGMEIFRSRVEKIGVPGAGFSALLRDFEKRGRLHGCKVFRGAPMVSHMLFTDDSYIYCQASEEGVRRRIGNGSSVSVLLDAWLPDDDNPKVTSTHPALLGQCVNSLMMTLGIGVWKKGAFPDKISVYKSLQVRKETSSQPNSSPVWNGIWKLRVPPKEHASIDWNVQGVVSFAGWLEKLFNRVEEATRLSIVVTCWALWKTRNDLVWSDKSSTAANVTFLAQTTLANWSQAQDKALVPTPGFFTEADGLDKWQKPTAPTIKINTE
uniref:Endonuclease/exonuclease/phosphatase domain-containing protein n=1 Tax=Cannabis sativa TaxID=3483 RepID=A0A803PDP3_CANSA